MAKKRAKPANRRATTENRNVKITNKEVTIANKGVAMKRPHNILNSAPDADRRIDTNIKGLVFWWSGITIFYLWSGLEIDTKSGFLGIHFKETCEQTFEQTFLTGLLILNSVFWVRLIWRILISKKYNKYYNDAVENTPLKERPKIGNVEKLYEKNMRDFNRCEKWLFGLGIPLIIGFVAIVWLLNRLTFGCFVCLKMFCCFQLTTFFFWVIPLVVVFSVFVFALTMLLCEYCREIEKECILCKTIKDLWSKIKNSWSKIKDFWSKIKDFWNKIKKFWSKIKKNPQVEK